MNYSKLVGYQLDTNQYTSPLIETIHDAKEFIDRVVCLYGKEILKEMRQTSILFSTYKKDGITLYDFLQS